MCGFCGGPLPPTRPDADAPRRWCSVSCKKQGNHAAWAARQRGASAPRSDAPGLMPPRPDARAERIAENARRHAAELKEWRSSRPAPPEPRKVWNVFVPEPGEPGSVERLSRQHRTRAE